MYELFYSKSETPPTGLHARIVENKYESRVDTLKNWLKKRKGWGIEMSEEENGFVYCFVNGGLEDGESVGRIFINSKIENTVDVFKDTLQKCSNYGVHCEMKIFDNGNVEELYRADKMVIYFGSKEGYKIIEVLKEVYDNHPEFFNKETPRFTKAMIGMNGVSFGQDPLYQNESFGSIRSKILAHMYEEFQHSKERNVRYDFQSGFRYWCSEYKVDPKDPAFNVRDEVEN